MNGVCRLTLRKSLVKCPCQKNVIRSTNGVGVRSIQSCHQPMSSRGLIGLSCVASSAPASAGGSEAFVSIRRSTGFLDLSVMVCCFSVGFAVDVSHHTMWLHWSFV